MINLYAMMPDGKTQKVQLDKALTTTLAPAIQKCALKDSKIVWIVYNNTLQE